MNDALALSHFGIICLQETWCDKKIENNEITASTNYKCNEQTTVEFMAKRIEIEKRSDKIILLGDFNMSGIR